MHMKDKRNIRRQAITMSEIARLANVSQSTVSRVLNGSTPVAPDKHAAVMSVISQLNYRPNVVAQGLVNGRTSTIGILTRELGSPFYGELMRGIATALQGTPYHPVIGLGDHVGDEDRTAVEMLLARRVDALILLYTTSLTDEYVCELAESTPTVVIGRRVTGLEKQCVYVDNIAGAHMATSYLIKKGHTRIAHITGPNIVDSHDRRRGYLKALEDYGIEVDPALIVDGDFTESSGALAVDILLARRARHPFSAIFVANDQMALGVRLVLYQRQIDVPSDISLIGYDDLSTSQYLTPPLTTIRQPAYYMGRVAAQALVADLAGEPMLLPTFPPELVVRHSVSIGQSVAVARTSSRSR
jgi:LacI family transcriptional regulator